MLSKRWHLRWRHSQSSLSLCALRNATELVCVIVSANRTAEQRMREAMGGSPSDHLQLNTHSLQMPSPKQHKIRCASQVLANYPVSLQFVGNAPTVLSWRISASEKCTRAMVIVCSASFLPMSDLRWDSSILIFYRCISFRPYSVLGI